MLSLRKRARGHAHARVRRLARGRARRLAAFAAAALCLAALAYRDAGTRTEAQVVRPVLVSHADSTRALALESVSRLPEPFGTNARHAFGHDRRTRIQIFALNLADSDNTSNITADAEDGARRTHALAVEHVGRVPGEPWLHSVTLRLPEELADAGDVLVRVRRAGVASNRVRVAVGRVGGGPPDDEGSRPTPAPPSVAATPNTNPVTAGNLTLNDVLELSDRLGAAARALGVPATLAVVDKEGNPLAGFRVGPFRTVTLRGGTAFSQTASGGPNDGLEGLTLRTSVEPDALAAISKAGTAALFSTQGNAFTSRTASFIIQEHIPPGISFRPGGPLYGVQFSQLVCSDIKKPGLPLGLAGDPGSVPLYKNGLHVGGLGIESDGVYTVDRDPRDFDKPVEELLARAVARGYEPPATIRGDNILVDGLRLPYVNVTDEEAASVPIAPRMPFAGTFLVPFPPRGAQPSQFVPATVGGVSGAVDTRFFPFTGSTSGSPNALTSADVTQIIAQAARQADITRAAIRQPLGSPARVSIAVTDAQGRVLGVFRTQDAPVFGFDVSVQKARTAAFFSHAQAGATLRAAGFGSYVDRAAADGLTLGGSVAFSSRAVGYLHRPFFPDGIDGEPPGPLSTPIERWSVFNVGLQLDLIKTNLLAYFVDPPVPPPAGLPCTSIPNLPNGIQIFAGSIPLYKNGELVGGIGISGDGIDQDDLIAAAGAQGFAPPPALRSDQTFVRGVRLPFVKFPRSPNL